MNFTVSVAICAVLISLAVATDYCSPSLCPKGQQHIACGNSGNFSTKCAPDITMIELNDEQKFLMTDLHNIKRNKIAGGGHIKHDRACRMATMQWDDELAALAALNIKQCDGHDQCRNTEIYKYSGQSMAWNGYFNEPNVPDLLRRTVAFWYSEVQHSNMTYIRSYPSRRKGPDIGHFTVMVADRNIRLGCAFATYSAPNESYKTAMTVCNYAVSNMISHYIYKSCRKAASACDTGTNPKYPHLCSTSEAYEINTWQ